jgi:putative transposase/transposase-like zinc-binding protein
LPPVQRPTLEVAQVLRAYGEAYRAEHGASLSGAQRRVMHAIDTCRTAALGGHVEQCDACERQRISYNSCGNRHCPKCQSLARAQWIEHRQAELLDCQYFHVVFTLPQEIAAIAYQNKAVVYNLLFAATAETLRTIGADPKHLGAEIGFFAVLHTWGQNLMHHPHLHCVVPGGGLSPDGEHWIGCRPGFFLPVKVLSRFFRRRFLELLEHAFDGGQLKFFSALQALRERPTFRRYLDPLREKEWVVYAKAPFAGPEQVLDYVGRYTHRVAISNHRLIDMKDGHVSFRWKDYAHHNRQKTMTLTADEFIRRFLLHTLPPGLQRIRYYGLLGNRHRSASLARCRELLNMPPCAPPPCEGKPARDYRSRYEALTGKSLHQCPACLEGCLRLTAVLPRRPLLAVLDTS